MFLKIIHTASFTAELEREIYLDFLRKLQIMSFTFLNGFLHWCGAELSVEQWAKLRPRRSFDSGDYRILNSTREANGNFLYPAYKT